MGVKSLSIILDNPTLTYHPGQIVTGNVVMTLTTHQIIQSIEIAMKGRAKISWIENENHRNINYKGRENFFLSRQNALNKELELYPGDYAYPFSMILPTCAPSGFRGEHGKIAFTLKVLLVTSETEKTAKTDFKVLCLSDLNLDLDLANPLTKEVKKNFCSFWCSGGKMILSATISKRGVVPGDKLELVVEAKNESGVNIMGIECCLAQAVKWTSSTPIRKTLESRQNLIHHSCGSVKAGSVKKFQLDFEIPRVPATDLGGCRILKVEYVIMISASCKQTTETLDLTLPVIIGDIAIGEEVGPPPLFATYAPPPLLANVTRLVNKNAVIEPTDNGRQDEEEDDDVDAIRAQLSGVDLNGACYRSDVHGYFPKAIVG